MRALEDDGRRLNIVVTRAALSELDCNEKNSRMGHGWSCLIFLTKMTHHLSSS
jgi:hypothetical protein